MNTITSADPFAEAVARVVRAHARDGLAELGHFFVFAGAAAIAAVKLWLPAALGPAMLGFLAASFLLRHFSDRIRQRITTSRMGYVGQGSLRPAHLLLVAIPGALVLLLGWFGVARADVALLVIACFLGGLEILKGSFAGVPRMVALGAFSILLAGGLTFAGWGFLLNLLVWASIEASIYLTVGSFLLWSYLR